MPRKTNFEQGIENYTDLVAVQPADRTLVLDTLQSLENNGTQLMGEGRLKTQAFAEKMHGIYAGLADVEVVPPFTKAQKTNQAGKLAMYGTMAEVAVPKPNRNSKRRTTPKDTDGRKQ